MTDGGAIAGYCATGSVSDRQRARQHDDDGDDPGEDRTVDEEVGHQRASSWPAALGDARSRAIRRCRTSAPGWTFCPPSTITRSPACSRSRPATGRRPCRRSSHPLLDLVVGSTTSADGLALGVARDTLLRHAAAPARRRPAGQRAHVHARQQQAIRIGEPRRAA